MAWKVSRWWTLMAACFIEICAGAMYTFSVYAPDLKEKLHYSQAQIQGVALAFNIGGYFSLPCGIIYDKVGPRITGMIGVVFVFSGYFVLWAAASGLIPANFWLVCVSGVLAGNSGCWFDTAALVTSAHNFPEHRAAVMGVLKSFLGLSASVNTQIYLTLFAPNSLHFILFIAVFLASLALILLSLVNHNAEGGTRVDGVVNKRLGYVYALASSLAVYQLISALLQRSSHTSETMRIGFTSGMGAILLCVGAIPFLWRSEARRCAAALIEPGCEEGDTASLLDGRINATDDPPRKAEDVPYLKALRSLGFWLIFYSMSCCAGAGLMLINNVGQVVESLGGTHDSQDVYVSIISVCSCSGRLIAGALGHFSEGRVARPWLYLGFVVSMTLGNVFLAFSDLNMLFVGCVVVGLSFGSYWALLPAMAADLFGMVSLGSIYTTLACAPMAGSFILGQQVASSLYQAHCPAGTTTCMGPLCFRYSFLANAGACGSAALACLALALTSRKRYAVLRKQQTH